MINIKRVYDPLSPTDGPRYLVDRMWPRGFRRESLAMVDWLRPVGPSNDLCRWFDHDPVRWDDFCTRYFAELEANPAVWQPLLEAARQDDITLLFAARDREHNNAIALKHFLDLKLKGA